MSDPKQPPRVIQQIERDVGGDLRKVGNLFKKLAGAAERGENALRELARQDEPKDEPKPIARIGTTEVLPKCPVCNDSREVGAQKKIPCPACTKSK